MWCVEPDDISIINLVHYTRLRQLPLLWRSNLPRALLRASLVLTLIALYLASTVYSVRQERILIQGDIERITRATTKSAQIHTQSIFDATIQILKALRSDIAATREPNRIQDLLDHHFFGSPYLRTTLLLNQKGINVASNYRELLGSDGLGYQFFEIHKGSSIDKPFTGDIIVGRISRSPHFVSSIVLRDALGQFDGVLAAAYELSHFQSLYSQFAPNPQYTVALYHEVEGLVVTGSSEIRLGRLPVSPGFPLHLPRYTSEFQSVVMPEDGLSSVLAYSLPIPDTQFHIVTFANTSHLLDLNVQSTRYKYVLAALFVTTVIGLMFVVEWHSATRILSERENMKLENELRQSQKLEALGTLAGGFAHDFNNLLSSIIGFAELAMDRVRSGQRSDDALQQVLLAGRRAESIVERILTFSQRTDSQAVPFDLGLIVQEAIALARIGLSELITIELDVGDGEFWMRGDPSQLHQVVTNLAVNAVHAMPDGGTLSVGIGERGFSSAEASSIGLAGAGRYLELVVSDTGMGIPEDFQARMYDPFFTTKPQGKGSGLGLSIVRGIVVDHGGVIELDSALDRGTEFRIWLPAIDKASLDAADQSSAVQVYGDGQIAVFVDDEQAIVSLGEERLAELGFEPHTFTSSIDALRHIENNASRIGLLITDVSMPELSGTELATRARSLCPDLPIIFVTAFSTREVVQTAAQLGSCEVLKKPLRARRLADAISRCRIKGQKADSA